MSIYEHLLRSIDALPFRERAAALLRIENPHFVQVVRLYFSGRESSILPLNMNAAFYREMLTRPSKTWVRTLMEEREKEKAGYDYAQRLEDLVDPITLELPVVPVMTVHGRIYDKDGIVAWLTAHDTDPCTREYLAPHDLFKLDANRLITCKEPATEEEFEKKTVWCAKRAQHLFDKGEHVEAIQTFKHKPSLHVVMDKIYTLLEYEDDPDEQMFVDYGTSEGIALEALKVPGLAETANMCLGMMEMLKTRADFERAVQFLSKVDSLPSDLKQFEAWTRGDGLELAAHVAQKIVAQHPVPDAFTQEPFRFLADCALYGKHGVPKDAVLARRLLGRLDDADLLEDMQVKWAHMLITGLGGSTDIAEGCRLLRTCFSCPGEAQDLLAQVTSALSGVVCVEARHAEYVEARRVEKRARVEPADPFITPS